MSILPTESFKLAPKKHKKAIIVFVILSLFSLTAAVILLNSSIGKIKVAEILIPDDCNVNGYGIQYTIDKANINDTFSKDYMVYKIISRESYPYDKALQVKLESAAKSNSAGYSKDDWELHLYPSGSFDYFKKTSPDTVQVTASDDELISKADSLLRSMDLLPVDFYLTKVSERSGTRFMENGVEKNIVTEKSVWYHRKINGCRVVGNSASVSYSNEGLTEISIDCSDCKEYKTYPCVSYEDAIERVKDSKALLRYDHHKITGKIMDKIINDVEIVYYDRPAAYRPTHLQPCYLFTGTITDDLSNTSDFTILIPALSDNKNIVKVE